MRRGAHLSNTKLQGKDNRSSGKEVSYKKNEKLSLCRSPKQAGGRGGVFTQQLTKGLSDVFQRSIGWLVPAKPDAGDSGRFRVWLCLFVSGCTAVSKRSSQWKLRVSRAMRENGRCRGSCPWASRRATFCGHRAANRFIFSCRILFSPLTTVLYLLCIISLVRMEWA